MTMPWVGFSRPSIGACLAAALALVVAAPASGQAGGAPMPESPPGPASPASPSGTPPAGTPPVAPESDAPATIPTDASAAPAGAEAAEASPAPEADAETSSPAEATGLDARVRRLSDALARHIKRLPGDHRLESFTVVPFEQVGAEAKDRQLGLVVSDLVLTNLARDHRLSMTERSQLGQILEERSLAELGLTQQDQAVTVGGVAGSRAIVLGQVADTGDGFTVTARVIDVTTAKVAGAEETVLPKAELIALSADAVILRSKSAAFFRSMAVPGWGQSYNGEPVKAALVGGSVAGMLGVTVLAGVTTAGLYALYNTAEPANDYWGQVFFDFDDKTDRQAQEQRTAALLLASNIALWTTVGLLGISGLTWGSGAVEAYASGTDVESLDEALVKQ